MQTSCSLAQAQGRKVENDKREAELIVAVKRNAAQRLTRASVNLDCLGRI